MDRPLFFGNGAAQGPVVRGVFRFGETRVAEFDIIGKRDGIGIIRACFQQQH
jgi:hypothetical protein